MSGWRPLLRLAWRDITRHRGRTLVVFLMIMLPVLGVTAASTVIATADVDAAQQVERDFGTADVRLSVGQMFGENPDGAKLPEALDSAQDDVERAVGPGTRTLQRLQGAVRVTTDDGAARVDAAETDLRDPLATGTYRLMEGRLPRAGHEVVVNANLAEAGPGVGEDLVVRDGNTLTVVGIVEDGYSRAGVRAWSLPGGLIADPRVPGAVQDLFVFAGSTSGDIAPDRLTGLRDAGYTISDRDEEISYYDDWYVSGADVAVFVLVVVMALTEVVLLAGPAFAVSARRRQRDLALVAANGGTPRQVRAAVLATALVIGVLGSVVGAVLGIGAAAAAVPVIEGRIVDEWFGRFEVVPLQVAGIALFGLVSAVLAALVPAWIASRQDVVRVLTGRRGDPAPASLSPFLGVGLGLLGALLTWIGVADNGYGEIWIGFGAVATVLGAVALMPLVLQTLARLLGSAPLVVRYALRDGLRHRTRTVPAIGAVMATVAGVVALGIANASDRAAGEKTYQPQAPLGQGVVYLYSELDREPDGAKVRADLEAAVREIAPDARVVRGLAELGSDTGAYQDLGIRVGGEEFWGYASGPFNYGVQVVAGADEMTDRLSSADRAAAEKTLEAGGVVVLGTRDMVPPGGDITLALREPDPDNPDADPRPAEQVTVPTVVVTTDTVPSASIVVPDAVADRLGLRVVGSAMVIEREVTRAEQKQLDAAVTDVSDAAHVYVERGWQPDPAYAIVMLVLTVVGALLMVGGTLTATVLALADAGPDLATLSAVGAAPRTSRAVAMAIAFVIGGVGAVLGALVGAVPGLAATWPMADNHWGPVGTAQTIDIPWLLVAGIVVGVPVLLALVVGLCARSRLPLVARID